MGNDTRIVDIGAVNLVAGRGDAIDISAGALAFDIGGTHQLFDGLLSQTQAGSGTVIITLDTNNVGAHAEFGLGNLTTILNGGVVRDDGNGGDATTTLVLTTGKIGLFLTIKESSFGLRVLLETVLGISDSNEVVFLIIHQ